MPCSYKGTEPSPKGLGHCAHLTRTGTIMRGLDHNLWQVKLDVNGRRAWRRITLSEKKKRLKRIASKKKQQTVLEGRRIHQELIRKYSTAQDFTQTELKHRGYITLAEYLKEFPMRLHKSRREIYMNIPLNYLRK